MAIEYIKSPFNYVGGKYKLLNQLCPLFPTSIGTFVDVFSGGFNVGVNINSKRIIYNDQITPLVNLMKHFYKNNSETIINYIKDTIHTYQLSKTDKNSFNKFRDYYNTKSKCILDLYILICYSFNYQIRFNNQHEYNSSHGTNRSSFTKTMENNLLKFINQLHNLNIEFYNLDFRKLPYYNLEVNDFVYFDPPYYVSTASYNDGNRGFKNWTQKEETDLYRLCDQLSDDNIKWGLSNTLSNNGNKNIILQEWIETHNYKIYYINSDYSNSNYQKNRNNKNIEIYITNHKPHKKIIQKQLI